MVPRTKKFRYDIIRDIAVLEENASEAGNVYRKELKEVAYNGKPPVYDLRTWSYLNTGEVRLGKGITFTWEELKILRIVLNDMRELDD